MNLQQKHDAREGVLDQMRQMLNTAEREGRDLTPAEQKIYAGLEIAEQNLYPSGSGLQVHSQAANDEDGNGVLLDNKTLKAGAQAIANKLGVQRNSDTQPGLGDFVRGIAGMRRTPEIQNALSVGTDASGGYSVPTVLMPGIFEALLPASSLLTAGAGIVSLGQGAKSYNVAGIDAIPTAAWRSEAGAIAESDPTFKTISITPRSLSFRFKVSRELLMDSENIDGALRTVIAAAFAKELDRAGLRGTGIAPEIRGLLNVAGIQSVTNGANGAAPTSYANFIAARQAIVTANAPAPTAAIMHPRSSAKFGGLTDTTGQPLRRPEMLDSLRFVETSQIPVNLTVGTSTDASEIYVGDFTQLRYFMREGVSVQLATELYAATGEVGFFAHARVDVATLYPAAFALITGVRA